ncbi:MAG TPA: cytochrome c [Candidatus Dormibacteraeota bacterium]|nr:cytochrome c [Candidatus Dormibacteraeota bacterium]
MMQSNKNLSLWLGRVLGIGVLLAVGISISGRVAADDAPKPWVVPASAKRVKNPVPVTKATLSAAGSLFKENCALCHGDAGKGDGPGAQAINVKPANFTDTKMMRAETDGSIFWKMSTGRGPMPAWKDVLSEKERWELVGYIRNLGKGAAKR